MVAVTQLIYTAPGLGSSLYLNYDDTTLLATGLTLSDSSRGFPAFRVSFVIAGITTSLQCNAGHANSVYAFPAAIQLSKGVDKLGNPVLELPFSSIVVGHGVNVPGPVTVL